MLTEYQKFMKKRLAEITKDHPTMKQPQKFKLAAKGWSKQDGGKKSSKRRRSSKRRSSKRSQRR
jgi:hypothetical protein